MAEKFCTPDDPRADRMTYVAVCRDCGGWWYLGCADREDDESRRQHKKIAAACIENNSDFRKMRLGDIDRHTCKCIDPRRKASADKRKADRAAQRAKRFVPLTTAGGQDK